MHEYKKGSSPELSPNVSSANAICKDTSLSMCIVPVIIRHSDAKSDVLTYALLDSCSQGTFIDQSLLQVLYFKCDKINITVKTLNSSASDSPSVVKGLLVRGLNSKTSEWHELPVTYSRSGLPVEKEEIPTPEKLKSGPHLSNVARELFSLSSFHVGPLIGSNAPKLIEPIELVPSLDGGPYAFKTRLGWCDCS